MPGTGFRGVSLTAGRGATAQKELEIDWNYPVYTPADPTGRTQAPSTGKELDIARIYEILARKDKRPLLVLREFSTFDDPNNEKLSRKLYTEKSVLLSHWFNCVRLPHHVTESDHPFHGLYKGQSPPQLFIAGADGSLAEPFEFKSSRADLLKNMNRVLDRYYTRNPAKVIGELVKMLPRFDRLDLEIQNLKESLDCAIEENGHLSGKARKLSRELDRAEKERDALEEKKKALREIPFKKRAPPNGKGS